MSEKWECAHCRCRMPETVLEKLVQCFFCFVRLHCAYCRPLTSGCDLCGWKLGTSAADMSREQTEWPGDMAGSSMRSPIVISGDKMPSKASTAGSVAVPDSPCTGRHVQTAVILKALVMVEMDTRLSRMTLVSQYLKHHLQNMPQFKLCICRSIQTSTVRESGSAKTTASYKQQFICSGHYKAQSSRKCRLQKTDCSYLRKKPSKGFKEEDPGAGLMNMMKQMYQDGDDEMKRTIAKSCHVSQQNRIAKGEGEF